MTFNTVVVKTMDAERACCLIWGKLLQPVQDISTVHEALVVSRCSPEEC